MKKRINEKHKSNEAFTIRTIRKLTSTIETGDRRHKKRIIFRTKMKNTPDQTPILLIRCKNLLVLDFRSGFTFLFSRFVGRRKFENHLRKNTPYICQMAAVAWWITTHVSSISYNFCYDSLVKILLSMTKRDLVCPWVKNKQNYHFRFRTIKMFEGWGRERREWIFILEYISCLRAKYESIYKSRSQRINKNG